MRPAAPASIFSGAVPRETAPTSLFSGAAAKQTAPTSPISSEASGQSTIKPERRGGCNFLEGFHTIAKTAGAHPFWYVCAAILPLQALLLSPDYAPDDSAVRDRANLVFTLAQLAFLCLIPIVLIDHVISFTLLVKECWPSWRAPVRRWLTNDFLPSARLGAELSARVSLVAVHRDPAWGREAEALAALVFMIAYLVSLLRLSRGLMWSRVLLAIDAVIIWKLFVSMPQYVFGSAAVAALLYKPVSDRLKLAWNRPGGYRKFRAGLGTYW